MFGDYFYNTGTIDPAKWAVTAGTVVYSDGAAQFNGTLTAKPPNATSEFFFNEASWDVKPAFQGSNAISGIATIALTGSTGDSVVFTVDLRAYTVIMNVTIGGAVQQSLWAGAALALNTRPLVDIGGGFAVIGMRAGRHADPGSGVDNGVLFEVNVDGKGWVGAGYTTSGVFPQVPVTVALTGSGTSVPSTGFYFLSDVDSTPPPPPPPTPPTPSPNGALVSTLTDTFDGTDGDSFDTAKWMTSRGTAVIRDNQLSLSDSGILVSQTWNYNADSAFVKFTVPSQATDFYGSFYVMAQSGSPPDQVGFIIQRGSGTSEITPFWANDNYDYGGPLAYGDNHVLNYDPVAFAYLRVRTELVQISGDWYITYIAEAGPTPGQWTELLRSPSVYTWGVSDGFQVYFTADAGEMWLDDFNVAPVVGTSELSMKMPDGSFKKVGLAGQPVSMRMPDGSQRSWPGSGFPLYQKQPDGTWKAVIS